MKVEVDKLDINKLVNIPSSLNHLRTKVNDLDVGKLKNLSDIIDNEVSKNVSKLENKIPDGANLQNKTKMFIRKYQI